MKRDAILRTAARLFAERGFSNTPTILLAQEAGVAEGTIFRHFKTKDEIFFVLIDNVGEFASRYVVRIDEDYGIVQLGLVYGG